MKNNILALLLALFVFGIGEMWSTTYTITFAANKGDGSSITAGTTTCSTIVSEGSSYLSGTVVAATSAYYNGVSGLKLGTSSAGGSIKMNLASSITNPTIIVRAKRYNSGTGANIQINEETAQPVGIGWGNFAFDLTGTITSVQIDVNKYVWIESITVTTDGCNNIDLRGSSSSIILPAEEETYTSGDWAGAPTEYADAQNRMITSNLYCVTFTQVDEDGNRNNGLQMKASAGSVSLSGIQSEYGIDVEIVCSGTNGFKIELSGASDLTGQTGDEENPVTISTKSTTATLTISKNTSNVGFLKTIKITPKPAPCATPTFSPAAGTYSNGQSVSISSETVGATVYYTTDGTDPTTESSVYSSAISVTSDNTTIKALAVKSGLSDSEIGSATYRLTCATPTFSPDGSTSYVSSEDVSISCSTVGATIYYTTDGTDPTTESNVYSSAIHLDTETNIKAIAVKDNYTSSGIADATFQFRYVIAYSTGSGNDAVSSSTQASVGASVELKDGPTPAASSYGWSFVGWATSECLETVTAPEMYGAGDTMTPDEDITLYAVYSKSTTGTSTATFDASDISNIEESSFFLRDWHDKVSGIELYISSGEVDEENDYWKVDDSSEGNEYTLLSAYRKIKEIVVTLTSADYKIEDGDVYSDNDTYSGSTRTKAATDLTISDNVQTIACEDVLEGDVTRVTLYSSTHELRMSSIAVTYYNSKYNSNPASATEYTISGVTTSGTTVLNGDDVPIGTIRSNKVAAASGATATLTALAEDGYEFGYWKVENGSSENISGTVLSSIYTSPATLTMPADNVTISAVFLHTPKAWCEPEVEITGSIYLTSYKDISVQDTTTLLTISSSDLGSATSMEVSYLDGSDAVVETASSLFRLCADGTSSFDVVDGSAINISASRTFDTDYSVKYTPTAFGQLDNGKVKITLKKGDLTMKTATYAVHGRSLPEEFVIAAKYNDQWYALPNTMGTTLTTVTPLKITVNNSTTPTAATYAPSTSVYKGAARKAPESNVASIRLTNDGEHWLTNSATESNYQLSLSNTDNDTRRVWHLKSSDFGAYKIKMDPSGNPKRQLGIYSGGYIGYHGSATDVYLLPITNKYTPIDATVYEWGEHAVVLSADMTDVASATAHIDAEADPSAATVTAVNAASLTGGKFVKVDAGELTIGAVANDGKLLYIHWKKSNGDEIGVSQVSIPYVVAANGDMRTLIGNKTTWSTKEVHVLPGITLTADASTFGSKTVAVPTVIVYPGATLKIDADTLVTTNLQLRNGWTRAGSKSYDVARVFIDTDAALKKTNAAMYYDIYDSGEGKHYYPLSVPFSTKIFKTEEVEDKTVVVDSIDYDGWLAPYSTYGTHYVIKRYNGLTRATSGAVSTAWEAVASDATLQPGEGYIITAVAVNGEAIIRIPLDFDNEWTKGGEQGSITVDETPVAKNTIAVTAYEGAAATANTCNAGWNMLGVPYMSCYKSGSDMYGGDGDATILTGKMVVSDGNITFVDDKITYVSIPSHDFAEYVQLDITDEDTKLVPGWSFFVQIGESGNLHFLKTEQQNSGDLPIYAPKRTAEENKVIRTGLILSDEEKSDKTTILISQRYSSDYEIGADLEKMFGDGYTLSLYSLSNNTRLAFNAMSPTDAQEVIPLGYRVPADGEYTFSLNSRYAEEPIERLELIDYEEGTLTNLLVSDYIFYSDRTQNDSRFALNVVKSKETATGIDNSGGRENQNDVYKILINDRIYIIQDSHIYDVTGRKMERRNAQ